MEDPISPSLRITGNTPHIGYTYQNIGYIHPKSKFVQVYVYSKDYRLHPHILDISILIVHLSKCICVQRLEHVYEVFQVTPHIYWIYLSEKQICPSVSKGWSMCIRYGEDHIPLPQDYR